jgi:hypothetical protein
MPLEILPDGGGVKPVFSHANKSILDWYHAIPKRLLDDYKYQIQLKNNVFVSRPRTDYEVKPIVNI